MPQIFVSHSRLDERSITFLSKAAAGSSVKLYFTDFERLLGQEPSPEGIRQKIDESAALFVALSSHVESIPYTRDWVMWEAGSAKNQDIWIFESAAEEPLQVVIPFFKHYVRFHDTSEWQAYIRQIIDSYSTLETLKSVALGATLGAVAGPFGSALGGVAGYLRSAPSRDRPPGREYRCPVCRISASIHYPKGMTSFRCPACGTELSLQ